MFRIEGLRAQAHHILRRIDGQYEAEADDAPKSMVMPNRLKSPGRLCGIAIRIGSSAEVSAVALGPQCCFSLSLSNRSTPIGSSAIKGITA